MDDDEDNEPGQEINDKDDVVEEDGIEYEADDDDDEEVEAENDEGDSQSLTVQGDWHAKIYIMRLGSKSTLLKKTDFEDTKEEEVRPFLLG